MGFEAYSFWIWPVDRLEDFVVRYQICHTALLKAYEDSERVFRRKTFRVEEEKWKEERQKKKERYATPVSKTFHCKGSTKKVDSALEGSI